MLQALAETLAELLAPMLGRIRSHERTMWIILIALLCLLAIVAAFRFGLGEG
jgi:hypothetical protein